MSQWRRVLADNSPLILPSAADALTARMIERAGFPAYQIGGFALAAAMHAVPDVDLEHFGEKHAKAREIIEASTLPVLVDADDGYGDVKNVTRTVRGYEGMGASAIFIEDQTAPKRCGHMAGKDVVTAEEMEQKIRAAVAARSTSDLFILARTDAIEPHGLDEGLRRGERYLDAGADGVYVEGPRTEQELEKVGKTFKGVPLATSILERGGKTPWMSPSELHGLGYDMILYPTTVLFRVVDAMQKALSDLKQGQPLSTADSVDLSSFEQIVRMSEWAEIENRFMGGSHTNGLVQRVKRAIAGA